MQLPIFEHNGIKRGDTVTNTEQIVSPAQNFEMGTEMRVLHFKPDHSGYCVVCENDSGVRITTKVTKILKK